MGAQNKGLRFGDGLLEGLREADGVKMGRPRKFDPFQQREALKRLKAGETAAAIGPIYGVGFRPTEQPD
ncbi:MAG: hypothetical protein O9313_01120 [Acetobacteraceae bacterium]|jgi:hypothetical protein|nr:hypothetical protein [Acetobacteraceae bacterium]